MSVMICLIDDEVSPMDMYFKALTRRFGTQNVLWLQDIRQAESHFLEVEVDPDKAADLYIIDLMIPAKSPEMASKTANGLSSGKYLLEKLHRASPNTPAMILTYIPTPELLTDIGNDCHVPVKSKLECLPRELANMVCDMLSLPES